MVADPRPSAEAPRPGLLGPVGIVLAKEWLELRGQRRLLIGIFLLPVVFTVLPLIGAFVAGQAPPGMRGTPPPAALSPAFAGLSARELAQALLAQQYALLILLMPMAIPSVIAAYSIVGEKTNRTLEPLLATPVETWQLLLGKCLGALLPALGVTWACGAVFVGGLALIAAGPRVVPAVVTPGWLIVFALCTPLLALIAIALTVAISSRVDDPRTAQQFASMLALPLMGVLIAQLTGLLVLSPAVALAAAAGLAVVAALAIWVAARLFQREVILTRWT